MPPSPEALKTLEARLNKDAQLQAAFLKDPVSVLRREGVELTPAMVRAIKSQVTEIGLAKLPKAAKPKIVISISIRVKF
jgi:hypothetical protein